MFLILSYSMSKDIKIIRDTTKDEKVRRFATDVARESVERWGATFATAKYIAEKLDYNFSGKWCCVLGKTAYYWYSHYFNDNFIHVKIGDINVEMFQSSK